MQFSVWIGWEPREAQAYAIARHSLKRRTRNHVPVFGLIANNLRASGEYTRHEEIQVFDGPDGTKRKVRWDFVSGAPMATEFACSRFLVPHLARKFKTAGEYKRWAVFMDCDMLVRHDITELFTAIEWSSKAVMVVKHDHRPKDGSTKMDGQIQTAYSRKNWSSVCAFSLDHPSNEVLTPELVNGTPGRELHAFNWLRDDEIGELDPKWNYLVGHTKGVDDPGIVHFTDGIPAMDGYEDCEYADEWRAELERWAEHG